MKVTDFTKRALEIRRERRKLESFGYTEIEADWRLHRGKYSEDGYGIIDVKISVDRRKVWVKVGRLPPLLRPRLRVDGGGA